MKNTKGQISLFLFLILFSFSSMVIATTINYITNHREALDVLGLKDSATISEIEQKAQKLKDEVKKNKENLNAPDEKIKMIEQAKQFLIKEIYKKSDEDFNKEQKKLRESPEIKKWMKKWQEEPTSSN